MEERRVFGPPGTGKTTFLSTQVRKWAVEYGSDALMLASFTKSAATELASRDLPLGRRQVGTLHSFAYQSLDGPEIAEPHAREFNEMHPGWRLTLSDSGVDLDEPVAERSSSTPGDKALSHAELLRARQVPRDRWPQEPRMFGEAWDGWKRETGRVDFTDLIELALLDTVHAPGSPSIGCFDEVQDFTPLELSLVRSWGEHMEIVLLAGDDDQCIYGFKGATPDAFLDPPVGDDQKRVLHQSYRVPTAVHAVASKWVERLTRREPKDYTPRVDSEGAVRILPGASFRAPELVIRDAMQQVEQGRSVMILTTCSYMLDPTKAILRREGLPFHNPYRRKRGDWNPLGVSTSRRRTASDRLLAFLRTQPDAWGDDARFWTYEDLRWWIDPLKSEGILKRGAKSSLDGKPGAHEASLEDFDALWTDAAMAELHRVYGGDVAWYAEHLLASKAKPFDFPLKVARRHGAATLRETPSIIIGTIHSVKGGEADVVYLFPDLSLAGLREWEAGGVMRDGIVRQMYVGMTRAREELVVCSQATPMAVEPRLLIHG